MNKKRTIALLIIALLCIDQCVKIWIKTHMTLGESIVVFHDWFIIHFTENPGAAWGMSLGGNWGKLALSLFRIVLSSALIWYLGKLLRKQAPTGVIVGMTLILAGAIGNILDSAFYGLLFSESTFTQVAQWGGHYAGFLHGKVVDMLYLPLVRNAAGRVMFFNPVFNLADTYISVGVLYMLIFQYKYFNKQR